MKAAVREKRAAGVDVEGAVALARGDADAAPALDTQRLSARAEHERSAASLEIGGERRQHHVGAAALPIETRG